MPLAVDANDNWWGANGGPGSTGARPGAANPVNGVQFFDTNGNPVPDPNGLTVDRWLHLTCSVPASVQTNVPAPVVGQVVAMPTVDVFGTMPPWFVEEHQPLMASSSDLGDVYGFNQVPNEGPNNAELSGTLVATHTGSGHVVVDLDSERVACPLTAEAGPDAGIDKKPDGATVTAGGLEGYRITVTNRGRRIAHNWWVCDVVPRGMSFVSATRTLRRLGRMPCLVVPTLRPHHHVSFRLTVRVARNASTTETNMEEVIPGPPTGGKPTLPPDEGVAAGPPAVGEPPHLRPIGSAESAVTVRRPPAAPAFTG